MGDLHHRGVDFSANASDITCLCSCMTFSATEFHLVENLQLLIRICRFSNVLNRERLVKNVRH